MRPDELPEYAALARHHAEIGARHLRDLYADDPDRAEQMAVWLDDLRFDYARHRVTGETVKLLAAFARARGVEDARAAMLRGDAINSTEGRAVLHTALRDPDGVLGGLDDAARAEVAEERARMAAFVERVQQGEWLGHDGQSISDVVNLGIGGSDLGPAMVTEALAPDRRGPAVHFVSNVDGAHLHRTLHRLDPARTLFVVASKSFTTQETLTNARSARRWLLASGAGPRAVAKHFVALSTNEEGVRAFGIDPANMFRFWDWVGGRFSLWSVIGLPIALATSMQTFDELCAGAHAVDVHFRDAPLEENIPALMALLSWWYTEFFGVKAHAVLPYDQLLARLPAYLQQAEMESNGKRVTRDGAPVAGATCPVIFGEPGTNGQHAFYQLLHQGTQIIPADFLVAAEARHPLDHHHRLLLANCFAQAEALARGRTADEVRAGLGKEGEALVAHRTFPGNRPSSLFLYRRLDAATLGKLIALYEHKIFVQGVLWGVNSFDQWGVELGKVLAKAIAPSLEPDAAVTVDDPSTAVAIDVVKAMRGERR